LQKSRAGLPVQLHLNAGSVFTNCKETATLELALGITSRFSSLPGISLEVKSETRPFIPRRSFGNAISLDPIRIVPSVAFSLPHGFDMLLAAEIGICKGGDADRSNWYKAGYAYMTKTVPFYGVVLSVAYKRNPSGFPGAGALSTFITQQAEGDRDSDGIPDSIDACAGTPEDRDGFNDLDGCPDYDNDNDGIADEVDGCPDNPEDKDGLEDNDGCPDYDNDRDGLADTVDACPDEYGLEEYRGCQDVGLLSFTRKVASEITFETGLSKMITGSDALDRLCETMAKTPKSTVEIQVHTDNQGSTAANAELSQSRADMLKLYLVTKGISPGRIKAIGLGSEFPIADNSTEEGRMKNQRVEVRRVE
jgi:outer membrane protein OmpA-like peptidoglycan-associated protein